MGRHHTNTRPHTKAHNPILARAMRQQGLRAAIASTNTTEENEALGLYPGYYMRVGKRSQETSHWIGSTVQDARDNIERAGELFLGEKPGYDYDIQYSHGRVLNCASPWANASALDAVLL